MHEWTLESILGLSLDEFEQINRSGERLYRPRAFDGDQLNSLISVEDVEELLNTAPLVAPTVQVVMDRTRISADRYSLGTGVNGRGTPFIDPVKLFRCFRDGATIELRNLQRYWAPLRAACWSLSAELGCAVTVNGFLSPTQVQSLNPHFDHHDIIVFQVAGSKEWMAYEKNAAFPLHNNNWRRVKDSVDPHLLGDDPTVAGSDLLHPGDVLFIPRGGSHGVRSLDEVSLHLTFQLQQKTYYDIISAAQQLVGKSKSLREPLPLGDAGITVADIPTRRRALEGLADLVETVDSRDLEWALHKESHVDMHESAIPMVRVYECLREFSEETTVVRRADLLFALDETLSGLTVRLRDRTITLPIEYRDIVRTAMSGEAVSARTIASVNHKIARQILEALLREGALVPV
jgi:hypothetical protein